MRDKRVAAPGYDDHERTLEWVLNSLVPLTPAEALARQPTLEAFGVREGDGHHYFKCMRFDEATNKCTDYENRPGVCRGFPGYGGPVYKHNLVAYPDCGYHSVAVDAIDIDTGTVKEEHSG